MYARVTENRTNFCFSLAKKHQLEQCEMYLRKETFDVDVSFSALKNNSFDTEITFRETKYEKVFSVFLFNTNFKTDSVILVNNSQRFARLVDIYRDISVNKFDKVQIHHFTAKIQYFETKTFNEHYQAYLVDLSSEYDIVPLNNFAINKTRKIHVKSNECYIVCPDYF